MSFKSLLGLWGMLEVPDWGLASWLWFEIDHWSLTHPWSEFGLSILIFKVQRTSISFKSSFWLWRTLKFPDLGWHLDLDFDMVTGLWYIHDPNLDPLSWFWRCQKYQCPSCPHLGLWKMLDVPDWGLAPWSWFKYGKWSLIHPWSKFGPSTSILKILPPHQENTVFSFFCLGDQVY